jgi:pimeloyl-ACP methyl ester carboxylesterase
MKNGGARSTREKASPSTRDLSTEEWPFASRFSRIQGHEIHYIDEGGGPLLLFVHVGFWSFVWRDVITRLRAEFRCIALDFPGTGFSTPSSSHENTLAANSKVLELFVEELGLGDITLVLHDLGGPVGFAFGGRRPELVRALVISNTFGWPLAEYKWIHRMLGFMSGSPMSALNRRFNVVARMSSRRFGVGKRLSNEGRKTFLLPFSAPRTRATWSELIGDPLRDEEGLGAINQVLMSVLRDLPALTIFGERNDPYDWQARYARAFSNAQSVVIDKGMHFPFMDDPDRFAASVRSWWKSTTPTST